MTANWRDHDTAHREIFAHPQAIEDLLRHFIQGSWVQDLDFSTLKRETEVSVTRRAGLQIRDLVWSIQFEGQDLFIVVLVEFQSRNEKSMCLRLGHYALSIYQDLLRQKRKTASGKLPPVLPIVLYNGTRPWRATLSIEEMVAEVPEGLAPYQPRMSYILLDEIRTPVTVSEQERSIIASFFALQQGKDQDEVLRAILMLLQLLQAPEHESLRQAFKSFIYKVLPTEYAPIAKVFDQPEKAMTLAERLIRNEKRQRAAAHKEGRKEGLQEGLQEGQRRTLAQQLQLKFGTVDPLTLARLDAADSRMLDRLALRILTAQSLEELWN